VTTQLHRVHQAVRLSIALIALVTWASPARGGFLYWSDGGGVHRANAADGSDVRSYPFFAQNLRGQGGKLYSIFDNQVSASNLDGSNYQAAPNAPATVRTSFATSRATRSGTSTRPPPTGAMSSAMATATRSRQPATFSPRR